MDESVSSNTTDNSIYSKETMASIHQEGLTRRKKSLITSAIDSNLTDLISENLRNIKSRYIKRDIFYVTNLPRISIVDYLNRILKYSEISISSLILAVIYIDKMCEQQRYVLSQHNIHRLILSSCVISTKFNEDKTFNNSYFAKIGGVSGKEMNQLEYEFYVLLDFKLMVDKGYYEKYLNYFSRYSKANDINSGY